MGLWGGDFEGGLFFANACNEIGEGGHQLDTQVMLVIVHHRLENIH